MPEHPAASLIDQPSSVDDENRMKKHIGVLLSGIALLAPGAALAKSTAATDVANGAAADGHVAGPVGEIVGGTVGAAVEIPNAVITSVQDERVPLGDGAGEVVVGEPLPQKAERLCVGRCANGPRGLFCR
jgi:hypothetical protein